MNFVPWSITNCCITITETIVMMATITSNDNELKELATVALTFVADLNLLKNRACKCPCSG